jgi:hypothetical protein
VPIEDVAGTVKELCGDELLLRPIPELATGYVFAG